MAVIGTKKTDFEALPAWQRYAIRSVINVVSFGDPVEYEDGAGDVWYLFSDLRLSVSFVERFFWFLVTLVPNVTDYPQRVSQGDYTVAEGEDRFKAAADANGAPNWFTARASIPAGFTPVVSGE